MRKRKGRERDGKICSVFYRFRKPFVASNHKNQIAGGLLTMFAKPSRKLLGGQAPSSRVQQDKVVGGVNRCQQFLALRDCQTAFGSLRLYGLHFTQGQFAKVPQARRVVLNETFQM